MAVKINKDIYIGDTGKTLGNIVDMFYPVGSIYMSMNSTDPSTLFGGTWERLTGGFLYGCVSGSGQSSITGTATEGHTLTTSEVPNTKVAYGGDGGTHSVISASVVYTSGYVSGTTSLPTDGGGSHSHNIPYIAVFTWKRTA